MIRVCQSAAHGNELHATMPCQGWDVPTSNCGHSTVGSELAIVEAEQGTIQAVRV